MKSFLLMLGVGAAILLATIASDLLNSSRGDGNMILKIRWQRLVDDAGETCVRCGATQQEVLQAFNSLQGSLRPVGIKVALEENALSPQECTEDISESNRIWVADRPLEDWLGAEVGMSPCGSCCSQLGDAVECRTVSVDGNTYETIPAQLIVKAGLLAAAEIIEVPSLGACCP